MLEIVSTPDAPAAIGPYSQAVVANGFLFASGQVALIPESGEVAGTTVEEQAEQSNFECQRTYIGRCGKDYLFSGRYGRFCGIQCRL